ncbi:molybdenum cofactor synthesis [Brucella sp. NF 2653]|uniref:molybdopterin molybdotransferase MoeA n=1 Tax=unclassified Brucella TaxID=2632610 RepID=UPI0001B481C3|nr:MULTISPECIES: gephyrin-like molybdotransferase Glp [unclassified Brucella]EEZ33055.1 molybdenum cofactor synthesis domain-containing protein [Brucella sp. 83/13]EFM63099.1 molybdenum cofactor synthesis [Brucella sp. NF 2653]
MPLLPVDEALAYILNSAAPRGTEEVSLADAGGRVTASDITAQLLQPPFDCSAMDGYALIAPEEITYPLELTVIGESAAGKRFEGTLRKGEAIRIFTGAPMPENADSIIIQEHTEREGNRLIILHGLDKGRHIRRAGLDFAPGKVVVPAGRELDAPALSLAAASGHARLPVFTRPRVAILATGDELVPPGAIPGPDQIVASNSVGIAEITRRAGGTPEDLGIIADDPARIEKAISDALEDGIDMLVTIGGASVGDRDFVHGALRNCGVALDFWKIAMRPGKPLMYGRKTVNGRTVHILGLPGNPVSSLVCSLLFLRPLVAKLSGLTLKADIRAARLGVAMRANDHRRDFIRVTVESEPDGTLVATPFPMQDSSMLSALVCSDALLIREENAPEALPGDPCRILML